jgi:hypothetical protein
MNKVACLPNVLYELFAHGPHVALVCQGAEKGERLPLDGIVVVGEAVEDAVLLRLGEVGRPRIAHKDLKGGERGVLAVVVLALQQTADVVQGSKYCQDFHIN